MVDVVSHQEVFVSVLRKLLSINEKGFFIAGSQSPPQLVAKDTSSGLALQQSQRASEGAGEDPNALLLSHPLLLLPHSLRVVRGKSLNH